MTGDRRDREYRLDEDEQGVDPETDRIWLDREREMYLYEAPPFRLVNDPALDELGVFVTAQLYALELAYQPRIVFKRDAKLAMVTDLGRVTVDVVTWEELRSLSGPVNKLERVTKVWDFGDADKSPEEHFVVLRKFVGDLAEVGLFNAMVGSFYSEDLNPETLDVGLNGRLQNKLLSALGQLVPEVVPDFVRELLLEIADAMPTDWTVSHLPFLDETYHFSSFFFRNLDAFERLDASLGSLPGLHQFALKSPYITQEVKEWIERRRAGT
ncbi:MAG: hypothetical protein Kow0069_07960 [Promethearchaeota archaeon]